MPRRIWAVVSIGFALCMSVLDVNIINIVLPTLSHDFGTSPAVTTWIINGYQLAIVVSLLSFSSLGEIIGYRKVFLSGIGLFCITSLICALSDSFWTLTIARIFQGFTASAITSVNTAQLRYVYPTLKIVSNCFPLMLPCIQHCFTVASSVSRQQSYPTKSPL